MGYKTKIDWCDSSWNPVTGCEHGCPYCYARDMARRFTYHENDHRLHDLNVPIPKETETGERGPIQAYPYGFAPTMHRYRLKIPQDWEKPQTIFVCSMADLFGEWVPDEWIAEVFKACDAATRHRYLFLTKNPARYEKITALMPTLEETYLEKSRPVMMFGASATDDAMMAVAYKSNAEWVSVEPILEPIEPEWFISSSGSNGDYSEFRRWEWVVIGAETGKSKHRTIPNKEWVEEIAQVCKEYGTPVFMKDSLRGLMGDDFKQEFPWEVK